MPNKTSSITPILVDQDHDRMCFLVATPQGNPPDQLQQHGMVVTPYLPSLKVHDSLYHLVEKNTETIMNLSNSDIVAWYRPDTFQHQTDTDTDTFPIERHFKMLFEKISLYGSSTFETFFWSSKAARELFEDAENEVTTNPGFIADLVRYKLWTYLRDVFASLTEHDPRIDNFSRLHDVCHYEQLFQSVEFLDVSSTQLTK